MGSVAVAHGSPTRRHVMVIELYVNGTPGHAEGGGASRSISTQKYLDFVLTAPLENDNKSL